MSTMRRLNIEVTQPVVDLIEEIQALTSGATKKAVIVSALHLLLWTLKQRAKGRIIAAIDDPDNPTRVSEFHDSLSLVG